VKTLRSVAYFLVAVVDFAVLVILVVTKVASGVWYLYLLMGFFGVNGVAAWRAGLAEIREHRSAAFETRI
jgi:hypothetical protein